MKYKTHFGPFMILCILFIMTSTYVIRAAYLSGQNNNKKPTQQSSEHKVDKEENQNIPERFKGTKVTTENIEIPILQYNAINNSNVTPESFQQQMTYLKDNGYFPISLKELQDYIVDNSPIPEKSVVITIDNGFSSTYRNAYPVLRDLEFPACIFVSTDSIDTNDYIKTDEIVEMAGNNITIGSNGTKYIPSCSSSKEEVLRSMNTLFSITNSVVRFYAYPIGTVISSAEANVEDCGINLAFNTSNKLYTRSDDNYNIDRISITHEDTIDTFASKLSKQTP